MIGDLDVADHGLRTGRGVREDAGQQIVRAGALNLRSNTFSLRHAQQLEAASRGPAPAVLEQRRRNRSLFEQLLRGTLGEELEDICQRKAVLLG